MKKIIVLIAVSFIFCSCVSKAQYNEALAQIESLEKNIYLLREEITDLENRIEVLEEETNIYDGIEIGKPHWLDRLERRKRLEYEDEKEYERLKQSDSSFNVNKEQFLLLRKYSRIIQEGMEY